MSDDSKKTPNERPKGSSVKKSGKPAKSRASNHHPDEEPGFNTVLESEKHKKPADKTNSSKTLEGISRPSALLLSLLAALVGGAMGWGGPVLFGGQGAKTQALQTSLEQTQADLTAAKTEQDKLADTLATIQGTSRTQASSNISLVDQLSALEDQVQKLQDAQPADPSEALAALEEHVSKLSTLSVGENEDGTAQVDLLGLIERLDTLEAGELSSRVDALEAKTSDISAKPTAFPEPDTTPIELPPAETGKSAAEALNALIETFPRTKMLVTVEAQKAQAAKKPSWIQRTLSRHIKTHDDQKIDPVGTINAAEAELKRGEINAALKLMGELNPPVRAIAAEWMGAAKKAAKRIEKEL